MSEEKKHKVELNDETAVKHWAEILHEVKKAYSDHLACGGNIDDNEEQSIYHLSYILDLIKRLQSENQELKCKKILAYKVLSEETLKGEAKADLIERIRILEHNWSCAEESYNNAVKNSEKIFAEQKAEIERLTEELKKATETTITASRCFTRMETLYKVKCKELEIAEEKAKQTVKDTAKEIIDALNGMKSTVREIYGASEQAGIDMAIKRVELYIQQKGAEVK